MKELTYNGYTARYELRPMVNSFHRTIKVCKLIAVSAPDGADVTMEVQGESSNIGPMVEQVWIDGIKRGIRTVSKPGYKWESAVGSARF